MHRTLRAAAGSEASSGDGGASGGSAVGAAVRSVRSPPDLYQQAGTRLQSLLNGVGDGEEELFSQTLFDESPETKVQLAVAAGAAICCGCWLACSVCGLDPAGGASLSGHSAAAAAVGAAAAAPLVAVKAALWTDQAQRQLPFLEQVQRTQAQRQLPFLEQVQRTQVVPSVLLLLPACTGGVAKTLSAYASWAGLDGLPGYVPPAAALLVTATLAGAVKVVETSVSEEEYETVRAALDNADRFYRITAAPAPPAAAAQPAGSGGGPDAAADAFRAVALTWLANNFVAGRFAGALAAAEVIYLGALWQLSGDLAAPLAAALAGSAVDFSAIQRQGLLRATRRKAKGPQGGSPP
eukprot:scaffold10.g2428.t1